MRPPNPDLIGMTIQEKRRHYARLYREKSREAYRKYQREYQTMLRHDEHYQLNVIIRRIEELTRMKNKAQAAADALIASYNAEIQALEEKKKNG